MHWTGIFQFNPHNHKIFKLKKKSKAQKGQSHIFKVPGKWDLNPGPPPLEHTFLTLSGRVYIKADAFLQHWTKSQASG
jgi:hypothetical protein